MKDIEQIYHNNFGVSFYWKKENKTILDKVQLVFRETGFYLSVAELNQFCDLIEDSLIENTCCESCQIKNSCHKFLLKTPLPQVDLAVSMKEIKSIKDLVEGTLFRLDLDEYVYGAGLN
ncbi:hypothetical protein [Flavobacterium chungangense]|uniref:Uncharacterized protein n=1 Tax=Flavobacterium chungangense TaxID=554283 RepID=A0A6V6YTY1_9FLAO|nr:hypothetical protein [Flavobacterium chungangense]CAD0002749.1 hypothetical protein FLACHUCJ7_01048 [Flavobacterium chungangense]